MNQVSYDTKVNNQFMKEDNKMEKDKPTHACGIAGLIAGIIGLLLLFLAPYIGIPFSITAVVLSVIQKKYESTGAATAGLVLGDNRYNTLCNSRVCVFWRTLF